MLKRCLAKPVKEVGGFTLIEVLVAIVVFTLGLLSMASLVSTVINGDLISRQITSSAALSQQRIEEYKIKPFTNFTTGITTENYNSIVDINGSTTTFAGYKRVTTIQNGPANDMRTALVATFRRQDNVSVTLSTILLR